MEPEISKDASSNLPRFVDDIIDSTDTVPPSERKSGILYRQKEIDEVMTRVTDSSQKGILIEGEVGAGKTSMIIEVDHHLQQKGIPHATFSAEKWVVSDDEIKKVDDSLKEYASLSQNPVLVVIEHGDDMASEYWSTSLKRPISHKSVHNKQEKGEPLNAEEEKAASFYQARLAILDTLKKPQFKIITTHYIGDLPNSDPVLKSQWQELLDPSTSIFKLDEKLDPAIGATLLKDSLLYQWEHHLNYDGSQFFTHADEELLLKIAQSKDATFGTLKRLRPSQFVFHIQDRLQKEPGQEDQIISEALKGNWD